jgi:type VI secretion system secreted protein Hcp
MKRRHIKGLITTGVMATSLLAPNVAAAANDMFLKIDGIQGESADAKHKGEIDVLSWSWGESAGTAKTKRGPLPAACIQDLSLTKLVDSATPALIVNTMTGQVAQTAVLVVRKAGKEPLEFLTFTMKNVRITSYQTGGTSQGDSALTENVVLNFEALEGQYVRQKPDGSADTPIPFQIFAGNSAGCQ